MVIEKPIWDDYVELWPEEDEMKGIWRGESDDMCLINGKEYEILGFAEDFDITEEEPAPPIVQIGTIVDWGLDSEKEKNRIETIE